MPSKYCHRDILKTFTYGQKDILGSSYYVYTIILETSTQNHKQILGSFKYGHKDIETSTYQQIYIIETSSHGLKYIIKPHKYGHRDMIENEAILTVTEYWSDYIHTSWLSLAASTAPFPGVH